MIRKIFFNELGVGSKFKDFYDLENVSIVDN